jgi:hypothetical protein
VTRIEQRGASPVPPKRCAVGLLKPWPSVLDTALYCFGDTRAFILALLTFTALSG